MTNLAYSVKISEVNKMKSKMMRLVNIWVLQIIPIIGIFCIWKESDYIEKSFRWGVMGVILGCLMISVVMSLLGKEDELIEKRNTFVLTLISMAWVPISVVIYKVVVPFHSMGTVYILYMVLYVVVFIGCCVNYYRGKRQH